jgi:hypothetical protein
MKIVKNLFLTLLGTVLLSCSQLQKHNFTVENVEITAEGPLFEGINTATGEYKVDISTFLDSTGNEMQDLHKARLVSAHLSLIDSLTFNMVGDVSLLLAGENTEMKSLAFLNPIPEDQKEIQLTLAEEQTKVVDYFKESQFTFVVDANILQDTMMDLRMVGTFIFELQTKN